MIFVVPKVVELAQTPGSQVHRVALVVGDVVVVVGRVGLGRVVVGRVVGSGRAGTPPAGCGR
jgi:hypothetical protein